ncbi:cytochrome b [Idiomarina xiamenensis]|uniref:Cytochrome b561 n=1 Tax=Idiomarina xiamenensis 10-D-4 TaxID=740709 RepID=K2KML9_9GAMM|nr:cytochrome b [Idiomarina xiamenensis]EKE83669.1 cytochrome b561 [Idiomarina xiamenensis 10-D-4]
MIGDSSRRYGAVTKLFHWGMAVLLLWQFMKFFDRINDGEHWVGQTLVPWHISIGVLLASFAILRIVWTVSQRQRRPQPTQYPALVKSGHLLLYFLLVATPLSGMLLMVGNGYGLSAFGFTLLERGAEIHWAAAIGQWHSPLAWLFAVIIGGHVIMAIWHQLRLRDGTLKRMW